MEVEETFSRPSLDQRKQEKEERDQDLARRSERIESEANAFWSPKSFQALQEETGDFPPVEEVEEEEGRGGNTLRKVKRFFSKFFSQIVIVSGILGLIPFFFLEIGDDNSDGTQDSAARRVFFFFCLIFSFFSFFFL